MQNNKFSKTRFCPESWGSGADAWQINNAAFHSGEDLVCVEHMVSIIVLFSLCLLWLLWWRPALVL